MTPRAVGPALALALVAAVAAVFALFGELRHDDAFITFQYARNLAEGHGWVFNPGDRVQGTTSPLQTLLLSAVWRAAGDALPTVAILLGAIALGAQAALLYALVRDAAPVTAVVAGALAMLGMNDSFGWLPLETNLVSALVLAAILAMHSNRAGLAGAFLGLAFLTRYEAGVLGPILVAQSILSRRRIPWSTFFVCLSVVAPWLVFSHLYFGSIFPHTLDAKTGLTPFGDYLRRFFLRALDYPWRPLDLEAAWQTPLRTLTAALWASGALFALARARRLLAVVAYGAAVLFAYARIGPLWNEAWHLNFPLLACNLLLVVGVGGWIESLPARRWSLAARAAGAALAVAALTAWGLHAHRFSEDFRERIWWGPRHERYVAVSDWVDEHVAPGRSLMSNEFGTLGWFTRRPMIDTVGLINWTNDYPRRRSVENLARLVERYQPDVVLVDTGAIGVLLARATGYEIIRFFDWQVYASTLLARGPEVLARPQEYAALRRAVPRDVAYRPQSIAYDAP